MSNKKTGGCLCKSVKYEVAVDHEKVHVCHCNICQKWHGGPALAIKCSANWKITGEDYLKWYQSSEHGKRGFCSECGSNLMFKAPEANYYAVTAGTLDFQKNLKIETHIFIDKKPSYYDFSDEAPRLTEQEFLEHIGKSE
jgi:hypothetical protein